MNWQVRNPLHCTTDGCTAKAEIEALRAQVAEPMEWNAYLADHNEKLATRGDNLEDQLAAMTQERNEWKRVAESKYGERGVNWSDLQASQAREKELREALEIIREEPSAQGARQVATTILSIPGGTSVRKPEVVSKMQEAWDAECKKFKLNPDLTPVWKTKFEADPATILELCALLEKAEEALQKYHACFDMLTDSPDDSDTALAMNWLEEGRALRRTYLAAIKQWKEGT